MTSKIRWVVVAVAALCWVTQTQAALIHRYTFNETSGTTVNDSVGTAHGTLKGNGGAFSGFGELTLPGVGTSEATPETLSGYVDLPNRLISPLNKLTIETWVIWGGASGSLWQRIFDFGTSAGGEDVVNGNGNYLFLTPQAAGGVIRFAVRDPVTGTEPVQLNVGAPLAIGEKICLTVTYDPAGNVSRMFSNGVLVASGTASVPLGSINDVNNWLGRSQWPDDMFYGQYDEFRVYDSALNPVEAAASYVSGPASPSTDPAVLGALQAVHMKVSKTALVQDDETDASATADFAQMMGVSLAGVPGVVYASANEAVVTISATGLIKAIGAGTANVSVTYGGRTDPVSITVSARQTGVAVAGTLYVDMRAADASANAAVWANRVTSFGNFNAEGTPSYTNNVEGTTLPGVVFKAGTDAYVGPVTVPDLEGSNDRSIEVWAFNPSIAAEETLVAWGHRGATRQNMSFNYGANATYGAVGHWGEDVGWNGTPAKGFWHYLVYTYGGTTDSKVRVYADGVLKSTRDYPNPLNTFAGFPIRLGAQGTTDGAATDFGQSLSGYLGFVRVHGGVLSPNDVKNNFIYGMEHTAPGALISVTLTLDTNIVYGAGAVAYCTAVRANYANRNYLYVRPQTTFSSSETNVATVDATGKIVAKALGTAVITATYEGVLGQQTLEVRAVPPTKLVHRYSFNEAVGATTVADSVGGANGILKGNGGAFTGTGQLTVPGGTGSAAPPETIAAYVDLPNGLISKLTDATFETWFTWGGGGNWQRVFDLGTSDGGEDVANGNGAYVFLSAPGPGANTRFAVRDPATANEPVLMDWPAAVPTGTEVCVTVVYDQRNNASRFYSNAVLVATGPASVVLKTISDVNNWLGRSQWNDNMFQGSYNEFRIWDGALTPAEVAASVVAGPNSLPVVTRPTLTVALGAGNTVTISWPAASSDFVMESTTALAGASTVWTSVDISGAATVGDQKVLTVTASGSAKYYRMKK